MRTHKLCESLVDSKQLGDIHIIISDKNKINGLLKYMHVQNVSQL